jgi:hypothetical protein
MSFWGLYLSPTCDNLQAFLVSPMSFIDFPNMQRVLATQRIGPHNYDILCIIFGTLLGDAHAEMRSNSTRISFQQEGHNMEHLHNS